MGVEDRARVLGVVLRADVPAVVRQFNDLGKATLRVYTSNCHASLLKALAVLIVELKAVAVAFLDIGLTIGLGHLGARLHAAGIATQAHRAT